MDFNQMMKLSPFKTVVIKCVVDWDIDEDDKQLENNVGTVLTSTDLFDLKILEKNGIDWILDGDKLTEWLSNWLSDTYGYCHNGFSYDIEPKYE